METIDISDYHEYMGPLISLEDPSKFKSIKGSINLSYNKILANPPKYLDKSKTYYFYCRNGSTSRRIVQILRVYGYNAVKVNI